MISLRIRIPCVRRVATIFYFPDHDRHVIEVLDHRWRSLYRARVVVPALVLAAAIAGAEPQASLSFQRSGQRVAELSGAQITTKVVSQTITFFDPHAGK